MNKGLEVIEAKWLFEVGVDQIDVVVHPQSVVHSGVQFQDGSIIAQLGVPDMKLPIQYALGYPQRLQNEFPRFNFMDYPELTFEQPDTKAFRNLQLAYDAIAEGGSAPCILNAANEIAVAAFLEKKVGFTQMSAVIEEALSAIPAVQKPSLEALFEIDAQAREAARNAIKQS
jgi:1-deoxy-D-xylulose-5-phosphate reductoisomerase